MGERDRSVATQDVRERLLTKREAADRLNVGPRFIERCVDQRRIRFVRVGRFIRIPESAIDVFIDDGTVDPWSPSRPSTPRSPRR